MHNLLWPSSYSTQLRQRARHVWRVFQKGQVLCGVQSAYHKMALWGCESSSQKTWSMGWVHRFLQEQQLSIDIQIQETFSGTSFDLWVSVSLCGFFLSIKSYQLCSPYFIWRLLSSIIFSSITCEHCGNVCDLTGFYEHLTKFHNCVTNYSDAATPWCFSIDKGLTDGWMAVGNGKFEDKLNWKIKLKQYWFTRCGLAACFLEIRWQHFCNASDEEGLHLVLLVNCDRRSRCGRQVRVCVQDHVQERRFKNCTFLI